MHKLFFVIGSSGAGKATAVKNLEGLRIPGIKVYYFDSTRVPGDEEMRSKFGGPENFQKVRTAEWVKRVKKDDLKTQSVILDGQTRPSFIDEACAENGVTDYQIILIDCSDQERTKRLQSRGQPELAHFDMMNWAKYLREECRKRNCAIIDNSNFTQEKTLAALQALISAK